MIGGKVDVLAAMQLAIECLELDERDAAERQMREARAVVAELIDKAARHIHAVDHPVNDGDDPGRQERTLRALNAALANTGPRS